MLHATSVNGYNSVMCPPLPLSYPSLQQEHGVSIKVKSTEQGHFIEHALMHSHLARMQQPGTSGLRNHSDTRDCS